MRNILITTLVLITFCITDAQEKLGKVFGETWVEIDSMHEARVGHAMVILPDGNILVTGGEANGNIASCEIYDLNTDKWRYTTSMNIARARHSLVLLKGGKVLAIGGYRERSCELFDPLTETWTITDSVPTLRLDNHTVTILKDGRILIAGGFRYSQDFTHVEYLNNCEIYNPVTESWSIVDSLITGRWGHTAILLEDGKVLIAGGSTLNALRSCEIYDPINNKWSATTSMKESRSMPASILLPNGNVFISGGDSPGTKKSCEIFDVKNKEWSYSSEMLDYRSGHKIYLISNKNQLLFFGGADFQSTYEDTWETYDQINLTPVNRGIFPIKKINEAGNSIKLNDERIALIGGEEFEMTSLPFRWPSKRCHILNLVTSVENLERIPQDYLLFQNFPNPFNPTTKIGFFITSYSKVRLEVYDITGRLIQVLINSYKQQGYHEAEFNSEKLTSGVYFYKITANNYSEVKKMILLK
ncbi:MAG: T9SS type A sorting domain-containing protein [Ignavibacteriales bacterium]|nr:T9SS type A sorting domain-containing protein [Ignavibacteriales bacterium]